MDWRCVGCFSKRYEDNRCRSRTLFWTTADLETRLSEFRKYFNEHRTHAGIKGRPPHSDGPMPALGFASYRWQTHCRGLYQTPIAACPSSLTYKDHSTCTSRGRLQR